MPDSHDPALDLVLDRVAEVPSSFVWDAWTRPELLKQWFCPRPWLTVHAELDLRPGGIFRTVMRGPDGLEFDNAGCFLEVVEGRKLVWTSALGAGFRPQMAPPGGFPMTAIVAITPTASGGTHYEVTVLHSDEQGRASHEAMGFHAGWNAAFDQLVAMAPGR